MILDLIRAKVFLFVIGLVSKSAHMTSVLQCLIVLVMIVIFMTAMMMRVPLRSGRYCVVYSNFTSDNFVVDLTILMIVLV